MQIDETFWKSYLAGFFDGEGCVTLQRNHSEFKQVRLAIGQKNQLELLYDIQRCYGGCVVLDKVKIGMARWVVANNPQVRKFLEDVLPYLRVKKVKAEIALAILDTATTQGGRLSDRAKVSRLTLEEK